MTIDLTAADRPIPDESDLRLLNELVANVSIPLANAAWNAQMSQQEAAQRLVSMAERGLPLRLVADGDRGALWQIVQSGPVASAAAPVAAEPVAAEIVAAEPVAAEIAAPAPEPIEEPSAPVLSGDPAAVVPAPEQQAAPARTWATHSVTGPAGEYLQVTILEVVDPAPRTTIVAGAPVIDGYRAVLVRSSVTNTGAVGYPAPGDANLVLETDQRVLIGRAGPPPTELPAFSGGIAPGETAEGWSLFAITEDTTLAGIKWCIRPDIPQTIVEWPISGS